VKVTIDNFLLAGDGRDSVSGFRIENSRQVQSVSGIRRETVQLFQRANRQTTITFRVHRLFTTIQEAEQFLLEHMDAVPKQGLVAIQTGTWGDMRKFRYYRAAAVTVTSAEYIGVTTIHSYTILCAELKEKAVDPNDPVP
jgi:hypothetical protein